MYPEIQASLGAHNLQLTNPQITCAGLECKEIIYVGLGHAHTNWVAKASIAKPVHTSVGLDGG